MGLVTVETFGVPIPVKAGNDLGRRTEEARSRGTQIEYYLSSSTVRYYRKCFPLLFICEIFKYL